MNSAELPPGLEDGNIELYVYNNELKASFNGKKVLFIDLPESIKEVFETELIANKKAFKSLQEDMGIYNSGAMLIQYAKCNYGGHDYTPDYVDGKTNKKEYWNCGKRGKCKAEGKVCQLPKCNFGTLTPKELQITILVAEGLPNKLIAEKQNISINTLRTHLENIREKMGVFNRIEITQFAIKNKLIII